MVVWIHEGYYRKPREGNDEVGEGFRTKVEFELGFRGGI